MRAVVTNFKRRRQAPAGRLDDHPAGRQELPRSTSERTVRAQDQGGAARAPHREHLFQGPHPRALPQRDLSSASSTYGVAAAALNYFGKSVHELTLAEAAYLAALPKAPNNYHPFRQTQAALERRNWVHRPHGRERLHQARRGRQGEEGAARPSARASISPEHHRLRLFRRGGPPRDRRALRREEALRGRPVGAHHPRPEDAGDGPQGARRRPRPLRREPRLARRAAEARARRARLGPGARRGAGARRRPALAACGRARGRRPDRRGSGCSRRARPSGQIAARARDRQRSRPTASSGPAATSARCSAPATSSMSSRSRARPASTGLRQIPEISGAHGRDGPAYRPRLRHGRRLLLRPERVQPRDAGDAPAGLVVQALRLRGRARQRLHAVLDRPRRADHHRHGSGPGIWTPSNYDGKVDRAAHAALRHRAVEEPDDGAARQGRRHAAHRRIRPALRHLRRHAAGAVDGARRRRDHRDAPGDRPIRCSRTAAGASSRR